MAWRAGTDWAQGPAWPVLKCVGQGVEHVEGSRVSGSRPAELSTRSFFSWRSTEGPGAEPGWGAPSSSGQCLGPQLPAAFPNKVLTLTGSEPEEATGNCFEEQLLSWLRLAVPDP